MGRISQAAWAPDQDVLLGFGPKSDETGMGLRHLCSFRAQKDIQTVQNLLSVAHFWGVAQTLLRPDKGHVQIIDATVVRPVQRAVENGCTKSALSWLKSISDPKARPAAH